jgi:hypothetical protein
MIFRFPRVKGQNRFLEELKDEKSTHLALTHVKQYYAPIKTTNKENVGCGRI